METWVLALELRPRNASRGEEIRMGGTGRMSVYASEVERGGGGGGRREVRAAQEGRGGAGGLVQRENALKQVKHYVNQSTGKDTTHHIPTPRVCVRFCHAFLLPS